MKTDDEFINEVLALYEHHKSLSDKYAQVLGILRGTPEENTIKIPESITVIKKRPGKGVRVNGMVKKVKITDQQTNDMKICAFDKCGKEFTSIYSFKQYCSRRCGKLDYGLKTWRKYYVPKKQKEARELGKSLIETALQHPQSDKPLELIYTEELMNPEQKKKELNELLKKCKETPMLECTKVKRPEYFHE